MKTIQLKNNQLRTTSVLADEIALHDNALTITPKRDSQITLYISNENPDFTEQNIIVNFTQPGASVSIFGLYQMAKTQHLNIKTQMNHAVPHCESRQIWRGILSDQAKASFEGKIIVAEGASKSSAHLSNKNLLLSDDAEVKTQPFLEIYNDDVQCSHGATVGCLDQNAIFYLRSRGLSLAAAKAMLIEAFVAEVLPGAV